MENIAVKKYKLKKVNTDPEYKIDYQKELNKQQFEAVKEKDGAILVIAGAGSGKTRTIVYRVARLIESGINPKNILLLTFTRKAANEMLSRASLILDERCSLVQGGTFHSFANSVLRKYAALLNLKNNFTIIDRSDAEDIINHIRRTVLGKPDKRFPQKQTILDIYSKAVNKIVPAAEVIEKEYPQFTPCTEEINKIALEYSKYKQTNSILDYDDLLIYLKTMLETNEKLRSTLSNQYKYVLVDEYQDTNKLQAEIVRLLVSQHNNIMAVGDDSQSIYSFRGANFKNIFDFPKMFPNTKIIKLEQNYRSSQNILKLANEVLKKAREKYDKNLFSEIESQIKPNLVCSQNSQTEAQYIVDRILELHEEKELPLKDIAVLMRNSRMSFSLETELAKHNIPYKKFGGLRYIETAHIKDIIAHLRVILNPDDLISWNRILLLLNGIGQQSAMKLLPILSDRDTTPENLSSKYKNDNIKNLFSLIYENRRHINLPAQIVKDISRYYEPILQEKFDDSNKRKKDIEHFAYISEKYDSLENFLSDVALDPPESSVSDTEDGAIPDDYLTLSTIHSVKGLEYRSVFIIGAVDGRFPSVYSFNSDDEPEEELRLMYVAITRAKTHLDITYPIDMFDYSTQTVLSKPSRFLDDISPEILERYVIEE